jgi:hypothetical protein
MIIDESLARGLANRLLTEIDEAACVILLPPERLRTHKPKPIQAWKSEFKRAAGLLYLGDIEVVSQNERIVTQLVLANAIVGHRLQDWSEPALAVQMFVSRISRRHPLLLTEDYLPMSLGRHALARMIQRLGAEAHGNELDYQRLRDMLQNMLFSSVPFANMLGSAYAELGFERFLVPFDGGAFLGAVGDVNQLVVRTSIGERHMHRQQRQLVRALTELYERERSPWIGMDFGGQHDENLTPLSTPC